MNHLEMKLTSGLGKEGVKAFNDEAHPVRACSVQEGISTLFQITLTAVLRSQPDVHLEDLLGEEAEFRVFTRDPARPEGPPLERAWKGVCSLVEQIRGEASDAPHPTGSTYSLRIVPKLWLLTQRRRHRVFQHLSIPDIVDRLLQEQSLRPEWDLADRGAYPMLEYKVQYGESDFSFLCRLLEEAGISFTFPAAPDRTPGPEMMAGKATDAHVKLCDKLTSASVSATLQHEDSNLTPAHAFVAQVAMGHAFCPGALTIRDHDFRKPGFELVGSASVEHEHERGHEQFHYLPGAFLIESGVGNAHSLEQDKKRDAIAKRLLDAERVGKRSVSFVTSAVDLAPGVVFAMKGHPHTALSGAPLLVVELSIVGSSGVDLAISGKAVFAGDPFQPPRVTPRPDVSGVETATVVGPPGEDIFTDEHGRVRVRFPWDREARGDGTDSCWLRVSQGWAGAGFGVICLPRVGQEVLVAFVRGDPDLPLVVGRVFNKLNPPPYPLPAHRTKSTWKSCSSPRGEGYNEITMEDAANRELVSIQAQRDLRKLVKHDEIEVTRGCHRLLVGEGQDIVVKGVKKERVEGDSHLQVTGEQRRSVGGKESVTVGGSLHQKATQSFAVEAGQEIHLDAGTSLVLEAASVTIKDSSGNFIRLAPGGIEIVGTMVRINSGGMPGAAAAASPDPPEQAEEAAVEPA